MSWLFGVKNENNPDFSKFVSPLPNDDETDKGDQGHVSSAYQFDSTALERAAKAARELEKSSYAREIFELTKKQEETKGLENMKLIKERELESERIRLEQIRLAGEEKRKNLSEETAQRQRQSEYQDQLARKRYDEQLAQQTKNHDDNLRKQEESVAKQEATRLKALEREFKMREEMEVKKIESQVRAQAISDRENREINLEKIRTEADERRKAIVVEATESRKTILESIQTTGSVVGLGIQTFLGDKSKVTTAIAGLSALAAGFYAAKYGLGVTSRVIESRLSKPSLIRETSRFNVTDTLRHPLKTFKRYTSRAEDAMKGIVFEPQLEERLRDIAIATHCTKANKGLYRNILFHGPPGTGKTMFAKSLANHSGMDYAIMTGGDVAPLGSSGVTAMHKVFDWAKTSKRGLLLFIDESDAFLRKRNKERISEDMRATLNAFLYHTGEQSNKFMLVLASNLPEQLDAAINNRIDSMVKFDIPSLAERERLVRLYFDKFVLEPVTSGAKRLKVADIDFSAKCSEIAKITEGFSGREISKLGVAWQAQTFASIDGVLTEAMIDNTVKLAIEDHAEKVAWDNIGKPDKDIVQKPMKGSISN